MPRRTFTLFVSLFMIISSGRAQVSSGEIRGKITDQETGEAVPFASILVQQEGEHIMGDKSDLDGKFSMKPLDAGKYDLVIEHLNYRTRKIENIQVSSGQVEQVNVSMETATQETDVMIITERKVPLVDKGESTTDVTTAEDIQKLPGRSPAEIATTVGGVYQDPAGGGLNIRGQREGASDYYIDGVKVTGSPNLPQSAIQEVSVTTGGVPANYGDVTGGIISINTRGPRPQYAGSIEGVTSGFKAGDDVYGLDKYGYNLIEGNISGPIWSDSVDGRKRPIIGFMLSGNYTHQVDPRPTAIPNWVVKDDVKDSLIESPLRRGGEGQGAFRNAEFLTEDDFRQQAWRPNVASNELSLSGKIDVSLDTNMLTNLTFGGNFNYNQRRTAAQSTLYNYSVFNYDNNPLFTDMDWRAFGRFSQRLKTDTDKEEGDASTLSNVYYQLQVDYSKETARREDATHRDNFFEYGYVGKFTTYRERTYEYRDNDYKVHTGFRDTLVTFEPSDVNRPMAAITTQYYDLYDNPEGRYDNFNNIRQNNGLLNGDQPETVYDIWTNVGTRYNSFVLQDNSQLRFSGRGSADLGDHALQIGFEYEQRVDRQYRLAPVGLWQRMRQLTNFHLEELNTNDSIYSQDGQYTQVDYNRNVGEDQRYFDVKLRESLGLDVRGRDYIQVDSMDPGHFSLDMFSADELLNEGSNYVTYFGYDHKGNKLDEDPTLEDFFYATEEGGSDANGGEVHTRPIAPYRPIYMAGYIMDKFTYENIRFNVGLRIDRFDANQKVLKDRYLLKPAYTVGEQSDFGGGHPSTVSDDAVIYVDDAADPNVVTGYREGDTWFNANGEEVNDPSVIRSASGIQPYLVEPEQQIGTSEISEEAFEDYQPQVNLMPRIAFSFNVRDDASFFAHYDVLTKRPRASITRMNPIDYFYIENRDVNINNPNLRPERTVDYEVGFQQALSRRSALKISAFYREMRNMTQITRVVEAYPQSYRTFGNLDFGTVKGMTLKYDLRRDRGDNVRLKAYYTLQFAEGTGSDFQTQQNLINSEQPNLRTVTPLNFDQRHAFQISGDLRFAEGDAYNGPKINGTQIFKNSGVSIQSNFGSGTPYSALTYSLPEVSTASPGVRAISGGINGSRMPWQFRVDLQVDKDIALEFGGDDEDGGKKRNANLNVYLRVNNLFNNMNVRRVYGYSGNADNDGYLSAQRWQRRIEQQRDEEAYRNMYAMKVNNPYNYGIPRTIRLGARLDF